MQKKRNFFVKIAIFVRFLDELIKNYIFKGVKMCKTFFLQIFTL